MATPPTARIEAWRREANPDCEAIRDYLVELIEALKRGTRFVKAAADFHTLRI